MLQLPGSGVRRLGVAVLLAGASCSAPDSSGLFGPASSPPIGSDASDSAPPADGAGGAQPGADAPGGSTADGDLSSAPAALDPQRPGVNDSESGPFPEGLPPPQSTKPGAGSGAPVPLPGDAGVPITEPAADAGVEPAQPLPPNPPPPDPPPPEPAPVRPCGGVEAVESCWYVGALGQSCDEVCATRGGVDPASSTVVGTPAQGGSLDGCDAVLQALGAPAGVVNEGFRDDGLGFGCHVFVAADGTASAWWLTSPDFSPAVANPNVQLLCGCDN